MKKYISVFWIFIVLSIVKVWAQDTIRVLTIGNSFSVDAVENYLYELGQEEGITFVIGNLYIGGCSLERHWNNVANNKSEYSYRKIESTGTKQATPNVSLLEGVVDENWDYISFQQNSGNSGIEETYFPYLTLLTSNVSKHALNPNVQFLFHQTWAYAKDSKHKEFPKYNKDQKYMYESIVLAVREATRKAGIKIIVPSGTAIQNGRYSFIGDRFCRDGYHLRLDLGRYTAACTWFETLTGKTVVGNPFAPSTITSLEAATVQTAAHLAVLNPFSVTTVNTKGSLSSDSLKRKAELDWILSILPPDVTQRGRVSYLDKTFKDWLMRTGELPPDFDQMPSIPFLPDPLIMDEGRSNTPVRTAEQWEVQREWMKEQLSYYITGTTPPPPNNLQAKIISETKEGDVTIRVVKLSFGPDHKASLTLELIIPPGEGPFPVFLTNWNHRQWAQIAVRRGYIGCLYAGADTKDDTEYYSELWAGEYDFTRLMRRAYGASRAVDYLYTLPYVHKDQIGITGHSRNGKTSLMAAAFDERIGACIPSSAGTGGEVPWRYNSHKYDVEDLALLACAQPSWLHPRLRFFVGREHKLPVDQNLFMALIAPRGLMLSTATRESSSNVFGMELAYHSAAKVYERLNAKDNLAVVSRYGLHGVDAHSIEGYIDFFDFVFGRSDRKPENKLYHNYSFEDWLKISDQQVNLVDYEIIKIPNSMKKCENIQEWEKERITIKDNIKWILGDEPAGVKNRGPRSLKDGGQGEQRIGTLLTRPRETKTMKIMSITPYTGFGENLFGYLYYPVDEKGALKDGNLPIVIYLHEYDHSQGFTSRGYDHEIQSVFEKLTEMGFGVMSFDMLGFGNRFEEGVHFYERYPKWSKMGKMVTDVKSAVDAASDLDFVDSSKIFVMGYSLGGTVGILSAAMDERIAGVASIAGFTPMRTNTLDRGTEGIKAYSHLHGILPKLGFFVGHENRLPVDFNEIIASIAPRPVLIIAPRLDRDAHLEDIKSSVNDVEKIYDLHGAKSDIQLVIPNDYSMFSTVSRKPLYEWFHSLK